MSIGTITKPIYVMRDGATTAAELVESPDWSDDWQTRYMPDATPSEVDAYRINGFACGIAYNEELAGPDGMSYLLFPGRAQRGDVAAAKAALRNAFDVVRIDVAPIHFPDIAALEV